MKNVFISHSSKDSVTANAVCDALEQEGISCWIAPRDITGGTNYGAEIVKGIRECSILLLIFSGNSNASQAVFREVQMAFDEKKTIIPLRIHDVAVSDDLSFFLSGLQWLDTNPVELSFESLIQDARQALHIESPEDDRPRVRNTATYGESIQSIVDSNASKKRKVKNITFIAAGLAVCLVLAAALFFTSRPDSAPQTYLTIYLSMNPEVNLHVNRDNLVVEIIPIDDTGVLLLDGFDGEQRDMTEVVYELVYRAVDMGFFQGQTIKANVFLTYEIDDEWLAHIEYSLSRLYRYLYERHSISFDVGYY